MAGYLSVRNNLQLLLKSNQFLAFVISSATLVQNRHDIRPSINFYHCQSLYACVSVCMCVYECVCEYQWQSADIELAFCVLKLRAIRLFGFEINVRKCLCMYAPCVCVPAPATECVYECEFMLSLDLLLDLLP